LTDFFHQNPQYRIRVYQPPHEKEQMHHQPSTLEGSSTTFIHQIMKQDIGIFELPHEAASSEISSDNLQTDSILSLKSFPIELNTNFMMEMKIQKLIASKPNASETASFVVYPPLSSIVDGSSKILQSLRDYADYIYNEKGCGEDGDLKIQLTLSQVEDFFGTKNLERVQEYFENHRIDEIILRRCYATNRCIDFHTDYSTKTLQMALNDDTEYIGGQLVFVTKGELHIPSRVAGTITVHGNDIVHGVTTLKKGIRYGLVFLHHADWSVEERGQAAVAGSGVRVQARIQASKTYLE
jgi:hypothetical protein